MQKVIQVQDTDYANGIIKLYERAAELTGAVVGPEDKFDCRYIEIAENIQDKFFEYYEANGYGSEDIMMLLLMAGPKVNKELKPNEVKALDNFIIRG